VDIQRGLKTAAPEKYRTRQKENFFMIVFREKDRFVEILQSAGKAEYRILLQQIARDTKLHDTLVVNKIGEQSEYKFLTDDPILQRATLLQVIEGTIKEPSIECYFVKNSTGKYVGFVGIVFEIENSDKVVKDVKIFTFGLSAREDENQFYKDIPLLLNKCLDKYKKVSWVALEGNKANTAYSIYTRRHNGTIEKQGNRIRYTCQIK
jgi:hypothetical protein